MAAGTGVELSAPRASCLVPAPCREVARRRRRMGTPGAAVAGSPGAGAIRGHGRLAAAGVRWTAFSVDGEPTVDTARAGAAARAGGCDLVIGFGGGSALDAAKAIARMAANGGDPLDYLEVVGRGQPLARRRCPDGDPDDRRRRVRVPSRHARIAASTGSRRACAARGRRDRDQRQRGARQRLAAADDLQVVERIAAVRGQRRDRLGGVQRATAAEADHQIAAGRARRRRPARATSTVGSPSTEKPSSERPPPRASP